MKKNLRLIDKTFKEMRLIDKTFSDFLIKIKQMTLLETMFVLFMFFFIFSSNFFIFLIREQLELTMDMYFVIENKIYMGLEMTKTQNIILQDLDYVLTSCSKAKTYSLPMFRIFANEPVV